MSGVIQAHESIDCVLQYVPLCVMEFITVLMIVLIDELSHFGGETLEARTECIAQR